MAYEFFKPISVLGKKKKKRARLTPAQKNKVWDNPKIYGRTCNICGGRVTKISDLELDHKHPYSKGGRKMNLAHRDCNRIKGSKSLGYIQKKMAFKTAKKRRKTIKKRRKATPRSPFDLRLPKIKW